MEFIFGKYFMTGTVFRSDRISSVYIVSKLLLGCHTFSKCVNVRMLECVRLEECKTGRVSDWKSVELVEWSIGRV